MGKLARELYIREDDILDLDQVQDVILNADSLTTSTFYKDLARIPNPAEITHLPAGIRSARQCPGKKRLFALFRQGARQVHAGLFDANGKLVKDGDRREEVMQAIHCEEEEPKAPARPYPEDDAFNDCIDAPAAIGPKHKASLPGGYKLSALWLWSREKRNHRRLVLSLDAALSGTNCDLSQMLPFSYTKWAIPFALRPQHRRIAGLFCFFLLHQYSDIPIHTQSREFQIIGPVSQHQKCIFDSVDFFSTP